MFSNPEVGRVIPRRNGRRTQNSRGNGTARGARERRDGDALGVGEGRRGRAPGGAPAPCFQSLAPVTLGLPALAGSSPVNRGARSYLPHTGPADAGFPRRPHPRSQHLGMQLPGASDPRCQGTGSLRIWGCGASWLPGESPVPRGGGYLYVGGLRRSAASIGFNNRVPGPRPEL